MLTAEELFGELYKKDDPVFSLKSFATATNNNDRETYPRVLDHILHTEPTILFKDHNEILKTIDIVANDCEVTVRASLSSWLVKICSCLPQLDQSAGSTFGCYLLDRILNIILIYVFDEISVRSGAFKTLTYLIEHGFLGKDAIECQVCPVIVKLSKMPITTFDEDIHTNVIYLMTKVAPVIGFEKTHDLLYEKFVELCLEKAHFVRKQCATAFPVMCEVLGSNIFETNMLPIFLKLCDDEIWSVRRACADVMQKMALLCTLECRRRHLVPAVKKFMFDPSQWVIMTALKNLGQFLTTFAQLRILGLAYDYRLELFITNAADQEFRQKFDAKMLLYSNQPNSEIILRNYETYEKMFEESITKYAALSALSLNFDVVKEEKINVDAYLATLINSDVKSARQSITSDSDDGGISKISDFPYKYYVYHQKPIKSGGTSATSPHLNNHPLDESNPLARFFKYCAPLKNNFINSSLANNYEYSDDDNDYLYNKERGGLFWGALLSGGKGDRSKSFTDSNSSSGDFKRRRTLFSLMNGLNIKDDMSNNSINIINNNDLDDDLDFDSEKDKTSTDSGIQDGASSTGTIKSVEDLTKIGLSDGDGLAASLDKKIFDENKNLSDLKEDDDDVEQCFHSHQFWYVSPPELPFEMETTTDAITDAIDDSTNNNTNKCEDETLTMENDSLAGELFYQKSEESLHKEEKLSDLINWENEEVEWNLLEDFVYMKEINDEMCFECAYNFPAIVLTFGKKFWPILHKHFIALCNDLQISVRKTMAASISKIALIIGREQATRDLVIPYIEFFKDADEIKIEVVKTLTEFVKVVDASEHELLIGQLGVCLTPSMNTINWRFRETVAFQIKELAKIHKQIRKENGLLYFAGLALRLMIDRYDCVRKAGIEAFVWCCHFIHKKEKVFQFFTENFAKDSNWRRRQTYIITADKMLKDDLLEPELFKKLIVDNLCILANDQIPNVRIQAARCLTKTILPHPFFNNLDNEADYAVIKNAITNLEQDNDRDVRDNTFSPKAKRPELEFSETMQKEINETMENSDDSVKIDLEFEQNCDRGGVETVLLSSSSSSSSSLSEEESSS